MNKDQEKEKLIRNLFQAVDNIDSTESKETISQAATRIYHLKKRNCKSRSNLEGKRPIQLLCIQNFITPRWNRYKRKSKCPQ